MGADPSPAPSGTPTIEIKDGDTAVKIMDLLARRRSQAPPSPE
jgi:hypothetical protein